MLAETKRLLDGMDMVTKFEAWGLDKDQKRLPDLTSSLSPHWPHNYVTLMGWYKTSIGYIFSLPPIFETQLQIRLESCRYRFLKDGLEKKCRKSKLTPDKETRGPTAMYVTLNLYTTLSNILALINSMNIDLRKSNMRVSPNSLQCWESNSKKMLCSIQSGLCVAGVSQLLLHLLKEMEKKLCHQGRLSTLKWYVKPLTAVNVTLRSIWEL
jgi:hypothetical protein